MGINGVIDGPNAIIELLCEGVITRREFNAIKSRLRKAINEEFERGHSDAIAIQLNDAYRTLNATA